MFDGPLFWLELLWLIVALIVPIVPPLACPEGPDGWGPIGPEAIELLFMYILF